MSRILDIGSRKYTTVESIDEIGAGGAYHEYEIYKSCEDGEKHILSKINFQKGPIKESGINGCHNEDLISIVIDRLRCFQQGDYKCRENALAITKLEEALMWLRTRTENREKRGVEGTHIV